MLKNRHPATSHKGDRVHTLTSTPHHDGGIALAQGNKKAPRSLRDATSRCGPILGTLHSTEPQCDITLTCRSSWSGWRAAGGRARRSAGGRHSGPSLLPPPVPRSLNLIPLCQRVQSAAALVLAVAGKLAPRGPRPHERRVDAEGMGQRNRVDEDWVLGHMARLAEPDHGWGSTSASSFENPAPAPACQPAGANSPLQRVT